MKINNTLLTLQNGSDIRGVAIEGVENEHVNLTEAACNRIGQAFAQWISEQKESKPSTIRIGIGHDSRISGLILEEAFAKGIESTGAHVIRCGLATTPAMFMSIIFPQTKFDAAVMLTASHLPYNRNGIKFFNKDGGLEKKDITAILTIAEEKEIRQVTSIAPTGNNCFDIIELYSQYLKNTICKGVKAQDYEHPLAGLKIVVDAGNGDAGFFVNNILNPLGADTTGSQFLDPDGNFPNHIPNPENKQAMDSISRATIQNKADLGLIFDTDVDRMSAVLHDGTEVNRDSIIAMISAILAPEYPGSTIITDSVTSDRLTYFLEKILGMQHLRYMRGYKNVINKCKELNKNGIISPLAMETSGHGALKDNYYLDDGAFLAVKLLIALAKAAKKGKKIDSLIADLPPLYEAHEYRFKINTEDFKDYGKQVLTEFKKRAETAGYKLPKSYEGVRISFKSKNIRGWLLLRLSLHDPVMPLNIEGERKGDCAAIVAVVKDLLTGFDKLDMTVLS
ncbi:MAG: phosphomannomutase/phosphoglucomutase [Treponema sp.]|jgi:phosphomannomutase|nr:phosphomannomutase/phosphoglucomutase [Treponema sp.]